MQCRSDRLNVKLTLNEIPCCPRSLVYIDLLAVYDGSFMDENGRSTVPQPSCVPAKLDPGLYIRAMPGNIHRFCLLISQKELRRTEYSLPICLKGSSTSIYFLFFLTRRLSRPPHSLLPGPSPFEPAPPLSSSVPPMTSSFPRS